MGHTSNNGLSLDACLSPKMLDLYDLSEKVVVVIDVFRATSTICAALEKGVKAIIPVASVEETFDYKKNGYLIGGERHGQKLEGFDFGNSPLEFWEEPLSNKTLVLTTTNGTRALEAAQGAQDVLIGSFLNLDALCETLLQKNEPVLLLCAGWRNHINLEDTLFAGAITSKLADKSTLTYDTALTAQLLYERVAPDILETIKQGSHYQRLLKRGAEADIAFCLSENKVQIVPQWSDGSITKLKGD